MRDTLTLLGFIAYFVGLPLAGAWLIWRSHPAPVAAGAVLNRMATPAWPDDLTVIIDATREPSGEAGECLITKLPPRIHTYRCGCIHFDGGWWSPCRPHDSRWEPPVTQWASEMHT